MMNGFYSNGISLVKVNMTDLIMCVPLNKKYLDLYFNTSINSSQGVFLGSHL